jgi:uncharacterized protein YbjQ (UPF0145 family)
MSKPLAVFTIQTFNQNALQPAGAVFAQRVETVSLARNVIAGIGGIVGGRSTLMEKKMNDLTQALMQELDIQAKKMYPNAVALINVQLDFSNIGKSDTNMFLAGHASATALIKRVKAVGQSMIPTSSAPLASAPLASAPLASAPLASAPLASAPSAIAAVPAMPSSSSPAASAAAVLSPQNAKNIVVPRAISGGKKRKSFISKSRKNRK